eukprot:CAMPEP_0114513392 /NCGR_PEP_ID=MMETSP0109-20121206/15537_1 /TAXON_ID=29199 /ORGANISM="Chlorarachnion reptans, Strain CCCM449" /LENGTH=95 /DNA_ID=CAMNT_0001693245 /DNA_START=570 /DNA_END=855 /DNA_ORIENTATION=-
MRRNPRCIASAAATKLFSLRRAAAASSTAPLAAHESVPRLPPEDELGLVERGAVDPPDRRLREPRVVVEDPLRVPPGPVHEDHGPHAAAAAAAAA